MRLQKKTLLLLITSLVSISSFAGMIPFAFWKSNATSGWAWMNSYKDDYIGGVYGTQGVGSTANYPGGRMYAGYWQVPSTGDLWVFGGWGIDGAMGDVGFLADLWKYENSTGKWTYVKGPKTNSPGGVCGTKGVANAANYPGAKEAPATWIDAAGNLWLFGGYGTDCTGSSWRWMNDLWKYDVSTGNWTWMSGSSTGDSIGAFGTKGTGSTSNNPSGRIVSGSNPNWVDASGNLWLFGGQGIDSAGSSGLMNDLWRYEPANGKWTWMTGSNLINQVGTYGTQGTGSTSNTPGMRTEYAGWYDSGFIWLFGGVGYGASTNLGYLNDIWKYEVATGKWTWVKGGSGIANTPVFGTKGVEAAANTPDSMHMINALKDSTGKVWIVGGHGYDSVGNFSELNMVWRYNPSNNRWTWMAGTPTQNQPSVPGTKGVPSTSNMIASRDNGISWLDNSDVIRIYAGIGFDKLGNQFRNYYLTDMWSLKTSTMEWTWLSGPDAYYQTMFQGHATVPDSPGSRAWAPMLVDGSGYAWLFGGYASIDRGNEPFNVKGDFWKLNLATGVWTYVSGDLNDYNGGIYGTKGTGSTGNLPGARDAFGGWTDSSGNLYYFGGAGRDSNGSQDSLNDLWRYETANGKWTWLHGSKTGGAKGIYNVKGTPTSTTTPGARAGYAFAKDPSGNFWLFGGSGHDSTTSSWGQLNDLWKYNVTTNQWTWMAGSNLANPSASFGTKGVASASNTPDGRDNSVMWADASGNIWILGGSSGAFGDVMNDLWKFDVTTNQWTWMAGKNTSSASGIYGTKGVANASNAPGARYYSSAWTDSSGNLWLFGGNGYDAASPGAAISELNDLWKYNISANQWTWVDGAKVINQSGVHNLPVGSFNSANAPGGRRLALSWQDSSGNFWLYGGFGFSANGIMGLRNDLWKYKP